MGNHATQEKQTLFNSWKYPNRYITLALYFLMSVIGSTFYLGGCEMKSMLYKARTYEELTYNVDYIRIFTVGVTEYLDCDERRDAIQNLFNIGNWSKFLCALIVGVAVDLIGPKFTYTFAQLVQFIFWILVVALPRNGKLLQTCFFFLGATAEATVLPLTTIWRKFKRDRSLIIALTTCGVGLSNVFPLILGKIFANYAIREDRFYVVMVVYTVLTNLVCLVLGALFVRNTLPGDKRSKAGRPVVRFGDVQIIKISYLSDEFEDDQEEDEFVEEEGEDESMSIDTKNYYLRKNQSSLSLESAKVDKMKLRWVRIKDFLKSRKLLELIIFVVSMGLVLDSMEFFNRIKKVILSPKGENVSSFVRYFQYLRFIPAPFVGIIIDRFGPEALNFFTYFCMFMCLSLAAIDSYGAKVASIVFYYLAYSSGIPGIYSKIVYRFSNMYGTFCGLVFCFTGILALCKIRVYKILLGEPDRFTQYVKNTSLQLYIMGICIALIISILSHNITKEN
ncbi:putative integral membrane protein [Theileria parva strain Muguga]|uniref:Major facilitator superfamily (MFS) profile domain-containing protein n=1 Tax=Theileria parva TaxID=5875 RepID=Q4MZH5_THEPA|nr:putative integral membrane protein [Theileria parva strain Muguga]EAN31289.1 putative integral membrane protein [Theileria parva strain Muguga]|eukprot:XP_763572.1 hypothetical protein [Theileria parva strain Muguga]